MRLVAVLLLWAGCVETPQDVELLAQAVEPVDSEEGATDLPNGPLADPQSDPFSAVDTDQPQIDGDAGAELTEPESDGGLDPDGEGDPDGDPSSPEPAVSTEPEPKTQEQHIAKVRGELDEAQGKADDLLNRLRDLEKRLEEEQERREAVKPSRVEEKPEEDEGGGS